MRNPRPWTGPARRPQQISPLRLTVILPDAILVADSEQDPQRITQAHGGRVTVHNEVDYGPTFTLRLPVSF
jgi:hypothetical protein